MENWRVLDSWLNLNRQTDYSIKIDTFRNIKEININEAKFEMIFDWMSEFMLFICYVIAWLC